MKFLQLKKYNLLILVLFISVKSFSQEPTIYRENGLYGVKDATGKTVIQNVYVELTKQYFLDYTEQKSYFLYVGRYSYNEGMENNYDWFRWDLSKVNSSPILYSSFDNYRLVLKDSNGYFELTDQGDLVKTDLVKYYKYGNNNTFLAEMEDGKTRLIQDLFGVRKELKSFDKAAPVSYLVQEYDEMGEPLDNVVTYLAPNNELIVYKNTNSPEKAFFDIVSLSFMNQFTEDEIEITLLDKEADHTLILHNTTTNKYAFWQRNKKAISSYEYDQIFHNGATLFSLVKGDDTTLFFPLTQKFVPLPKGMNFYRSVDFSVEKMKIDYAFDDNVFETIHPIKRDFVLLENKESKLTGVIDWTGEIHLNAFDSIQEMGENKENLPFIRTYKDGLSGLINLKTGEEILPTYSLPLTMKFDGSLGQFVTTIHNNEKNYAFLLRSNGKEIHYQALEPYTKKVKGKYGLFAHKLDDSNTEEQIIQPAFKEIKVLDYFSQTHLYLATLGKNKTGLINNFGDTLLPFVYTKIETIEVSNAQGQIEEYLRLYQTKNKIQSISLYSVALNQILASDFTHIEFLKSSHLNDLNFVLNKNGALNLLKNGTEFFEQTCTQIYLDEFGLIRITQNDKMKFMYGFETKDDIENADLSCDYVVDNYCINKNGSTFNVYEMTLPGDNYILNELMLNTTLEACVGKINEGLAEKDIYYRIKINGDKLGITTDDEENPKIVFPATERFIYGLKQGTILVFQNGIPYYQDFYKKKKYLVSEY